MAQPDLITKRDAAAALGVTPSAVQRMIDREELKPAQTIKSNGRITMYMLSRRDVERLRDRRAA